MNHINILNRGVGDGEACFIIAEACDNHLGNMETAKEMALQAKLSGADAVKFQTFIPEKTIRIDYAV